MEATQPGFIEQLRDNLRGAHRYQRHRNAAHRYRGSAESSRKGKSRIGIWAVASDGLSRRRLLCAVLLLALVPITDALGIASLATLGILAGILTALILYEVLRYSDARERVRHRAAPGV